MTASFSSRKTNYASQRDYSRIVCQVLTPNWQMLDKGIKYLPNLHIETFLQLFTSHSSLHLCIIVKWSEAFHFMVAAASGFCGWHFGFFNIIYLTLSLLSASFWRKNKNAISSWKCRQNFLVEIVIQNSNVKFDAVSWWNGSFIFHPKVGAQKQKC